MCHKTHHRFTCGCTKLKTLTFCRAVDDAEYLVADTGLHRDNGEMLRRFDAIMLCKIVHGFENPARRAAVRVRGEDEDGEDEAWIREEVRRLRDSCERDTVDVYEGREGRCVLCESVGAGEVGEEEGG
jgi:hypothetical protein